MNDDPDITLHARLDIETPPDGPPKVTSQELAVIAPRKRHGGTIVSIDAGRALKKLDELTAPKDEPPPAA